MMATGKALIRSLNRRGTAATKPRGTGAHLEAGAARVCERCGASFVRRTWRRTNLTQGALAHARWTVCPACRQVASGEYVGRVVLRGAFVTEHGDLVTRRIRNLAQYGRATQPERRVVSIDRTSDGLEVRTTSQKLAHRIVHELKKAFGGRGRYAWSEDGTLFASWTSGRITEPSARRA
jgi:NMD protein affecting ribosome stability and mRNA decay